MTIKILLLGSGGREHALATALKKDPFTGDLPLKTVKIELFTSSE